MNPTRDPSNQSFYLFIQLLNTRALSSYMNFSSNKKIKFHSELFFYIDIEETPTI